MAVLSSIDYKDATDILSAINRGEIDPYTAMAYLNEQKSNWSRSHFESPFGNSMNPYNLTEENEKLYNNLLSRYVSQNSLNWQAEQLQALGLSNAGVLQTGAGHTAVDHSNVSGNRNNRATSLANSLIGMAGRMASSGIYGAALSSVRGAAGQAASLAAHTANPVMKSLSSKKPDVMDDDDDDILKYFEGR